MEKISRKEKTSSSEFKVTTSKNPLINNQTVTSDKINFGRRIKSSMYEEAEGPNGLSFCYAFREMKTTIS